MQTETKPSHLNNQLENYAFSMTFDILVKNIKNFLIISYKYI